MFTDEFIIMSVNYKQINEMSSAVLWAATNLSYDNFNTVFNDDQAKELRHLLAPVFKTFKELNEIMKGFNYDMAVAIKDETNQYSADQLKLIEECYLFTNVLASL